MSPKSGIVTLTTDFGIDDPYIGILKGVILSVSPSANIVDIKHSIVPQNIAEASFVIGNSYRFFPKNTLHTVIVDPTVGSSRRLVILETQNGTFIAPDNGLLSHVLEDHGELTLIDNDNSVTVPSNCKAYWVNEREYWLSSISSTFHGRDIIAPVVGHLLSGVAPSKVGESINVLHYTPRSKPLLGKDRITGTIVYSDRFGNLISDIPVALLSSMTYPSFQIGERHITGFYKYYSEGHALIGLIGSFNTLEIAFVNGNASEVTGAKVGDRIVVYDDLKDINNDHYIKRTN